MPTLTQTTPTPRTAAIDRGADAAAQARAQRGTRDPEALPHLCRCSARWSGSETCHCAACHRTFTGVEAFDAHQPDRHGCIEPAALGMVRADGRAYEAWRRP